MVKKQKEFCCANCSATLINDEIAVSKKMFGRNVTAFYCLNCAAAILDCEVVDLEIKIQEFKEQGCALFM